MGLSWAIWFTGTQYRSVGPVEIVKVSDQRLDTLGHRLGLEHVFADKLGQVADRLHRHGLVEQLQCLWIIDTHAAAKRAFVGREAVE